MDITWIAYHLSHYFQEYLQVSNSFPSSHQHIPLSPTVVYDGGVVASRHNSDGRHGGSNQSLYGVDCVVEDMRNTIQGLAEHVVYSEYSKLHDRDSATWDRTEFIKAIYIWKASTLAQKNTCTKIKISESLCLKLCCLRFSSWLSTFLTT